MEPKFLPKPVRVVGRRALWLVRSGIATLQNVSDMAALKRDAMTWRRKAGSRATAPFVRDQVMARYAHVVEFEGRSYTYVLYPRGAARGPETLAIHFSAFFGEWGDRREYRAQYQGHFHRMRMFWPMEEHSFLFLCDTFGADQNGTYYKGEDGDYFVERAMDWIIDLVQKQLGVPNESTVTMGSSMGATAALRFALQRGCAGAIGVSPHIDLDLCAQLQGRQRHVAAVLGSEDVAAARWFPVTREIRALSQTAPLTTRIVLQSVCDDHGVHNEQVVPFTHAWSARGGVIRLDEHEAGGHTSQYATRAWFEEQIKWCLTPT